MRRFERDHRAARSRWGAAAIWIGAAALGLAGCDGGATIGVEEEPPRIAAYGFFGPEEPWEVHVYRSVGAAAPVSLEEAAVVQATVVVSGGGRRDTLRQSDPGVYTMDGPGPEPGVEYRLDVSAPGLPSIEAGDRVPAPPAVRVRSEITVGLEGPYDDRYATVRAHISLDDAPGPNYYLVRLSRYSERDGRWRLSGFTSPAPYLRGSAGSVGALFLEGEQGDFDTGYFNDDLFDGASNELEITAGFYLGSEDVPPMRLVLTSMSPAYFEYHRRLDLQRLNAEDPFADPVDLFSNVVGGHGIFGAYSNAVFFLNPGGE